jgi:hypothetical protein
MKPMFSNIILVLIVGLIIVSCSPVRSGNVDRDIDNGLLSAKDMEVSDTLLVDDFGTYDSESNTLITYVDDIDIPDTNIIVLEPLVTKYDDMSDEESIAGQLDDISDLLNNGFIDQACNLAEVLYNSLDSDSEEKWEARFYMGECRVAKNDLAAASRIFSEIMQSGDRGIAREKTLIRMGQIKCLESQPAEASKLFIKLRTEYPRSIYLPLAKCE